MTGFDKDWLSLREPADRAARHVGLMDALAQYLEGVQDPMVLDIGCGTGSAWRGLNERLRNGTRWLMIDNDPLLLEEARRRIGARQEIAYRRHDLNDIDGLPLEGASIVTASALFDLCSERFCEALADRLAAAGCGLYAALNYDGVMRWSPTHPRDEEMVVLFNRHQRTDKGFGPALGPDATACLSRHLAERGFRIMIGESPWRMDEGTADLQTELLLGLRAPLLEISGLPEAAIDAWLQYRLASIHGADGSGLIGHADLLALPA